MDTIIGNADTKLFLGGSEKTTLKEMEEILGKAGIVPMLLRGELQGAQWRPKKPDSAEAFITQGRGYRLSYRDAC